MSQLPAGFGAALTAQNLAYAAAGALLGHLATALPGLGPLVLVALLLPVVRALDALPALILLSSAVVGAQQRGAWRPRPTAGGVRPAPPPGVPWVAFGAACAGALAVALLMLPLAAWANRLGPADWVALLALVLTAAVVLASESLLRGLAMVLLGLLLAQVGTDPATGVARYSFGSGALAQGIPFLGLAVGLYAIAPAIGARRGAAGATANAVAAPMPVVLPPRGPRGPRRPRWRREWPFAWRRAVAQAVDGFGGRVVLLPLFSFGLPFNAPLALLFGAMAQKGLQPGPELAVTQPQLLWSLAASLWVGCAVLWLMGAAEAAVPPLPGREAEHRQRPGAFGKLLLPLRPAAWRRSLSACPERHAVAAVVVLSSVGLYTLGGGSAALWFGAGFGVLGTVFHRLGCPPTPLLLGFVLAPVLEANLRRALLLADGDWATFVTRPLSSGLLAMAALLIGLALLPPGRKRRKRILQVH